MEKNQGNSFQYTYSAQDQAEIRRIRSKYAPREETTLEQLQRMDAAVTSKATVAALVLGVLSTLVMGTGMSCCMVFGGAWFVPGIVLGLAGIAGAAMAYPLYNLVLRRERERIAPEMLRLTDELLK